MSLSATASTAVTASSAIPLHRHGHHKGVQNDAATESSTASSSTTSGTGTSTTQGLFGSLLSTLEQVVVATNPVAATAVSLLTPSATATATAPAASSATAATPAATTSTPAASNGGHALNTLGGNVNTRV